MSYHYKANGSLDMRFSSSKAYVSSGGSIWGPSSSSSSYGYSSPSTSSSSTLHYRKDGGLDMRYSSSKAAVSSSSSSNYSSPSTNDSQLHYKADGSLDMRYRSSKDAVANGNTSCSSTTSTTTSPPQPIHVRADGKPDMRFSENRAALVSGDGTHRNVNGSVDKRWKSVNNQTIYDPFAPSQHIFNPFAGNETVERQQYIIEIVSIDMLNAIAAFIPDQTIDENKVYEVFNRKDNQEIVYEEEARKIDQNDNIVIDAILSKDVNKKKLSHDASNRARKVINKIIQSDYPQIIIMQAKLIFSFLRDENNAPIYNN